MEARFAEQAARRDREAVRDIFTIGDNLDQAIDALKSLSVSDPSVVLSLFQNTVLKHPPSPRDLDH